MDVEPLVVRLLEETLHVFDTNPAGIDVNLEEVPLAGGVDAHGDRRAERSAQKRLGQIDHRQPAEEVPARKIAKPRGGLALERGIVDSRVEIERTSAELFEPKIDPLTAGGLLFEGLENHQIRGLGEGIGIDIETGVSPLGGGDPLCPLVCMVDQVEVLRGLGVEVGDHRAQGDPRALDNGAVFPVTEHRVAPALKERIDRAARLRFGLVKRKLLAAGDFVGEEGKLGGDAFPKLGLADQKGNPKQLITDHAPRRFG